MSRLSLKKILTRYTLSVFAVVLLFSCLSFVAFSDYLFQRFHEQNVANVRAKIENISHLVAFYHRIVTKLSHQPEVADLLLFGDADSAQIWAQKYRRLIPDTIGLALVEPGGKVEGDPLELNLGKRCLADTRKRIEGLPVSQQPVHEEHAGLEHFDVMVNVRQNNETIGLVFASFSLKLLQQQLEKIVSPGQQFTLRSSGQRVIARVSKLDNHEHSTDKFSLAVPGTDWSLDAETSEINLNPLLISQASINLSMFILLAMILFVLARRLLHIFESDFRSIHNLLQTVSKDKPGDETIDSRLLETQDVMSGIHAIARDIQRYQQQLVSFSVTDELTGLYNRRAFQQEIQRYFDLAKRGISIHLVLLDLDYFKQANDVLGHVAGDRLLCMIANSLREHTRSTDICARLGGDEFVVVLMHSDQLDLQQWYGKLAQEFRAMQQEQLDLPDGTHLSTISAGATAIMQSDADIEQVLDRADHYLYRAKKNGRANLQVDKGASPEAGQG